MTYGSRTRRGGKSVGREGMRSPISRTQALDPRQAPMSVAVVNAGALPTTRQMALAFADELTAYCGPFVPSAFSEALRRIPIAGRQLSRRALPPELARASRNSGTTTDLVRVLASRGGVGAVTYPLIWRRNLSVDRAASKHVPPYGVVIAHYGAARASFERAREVSARTVLDYPIARHEFVRDLLAEEIGRWPDLADTLGGPASLAPRPTELDRMGEELGLADVVVVGSSFAAASFHGVVESNRLVVVPYGVDTTAFSPAGGAGPSKSLRVLFAGQLSQRKGIAYLLEAMKLVDPTRIRLELVGPVVGSGRWLARYEGLFKRVAGVPRSAMPDIYRQADVLVLPSLAEGSALVVLEAMASGLPVIITPHVGADAVSHGTEGLVVPIRSSEGIAAALQTLSDDPQLREQMGHAARARALEFDWCRFREVFRTNVLGSRETP
jgi:starch synthase